MRGISRNLRSRRYLLAASGMVGLIFLGAMSPAAAQTDSPGHVSTNNDSNGGGVFADYQAPGDSNSTPGSGTPTGGDGDSPYSCGLITLAQGLAGDYTAGVGVPDPPEAVSYTHLRAHET